MGQTLPEINGRIKQIIELYTDGNVSKFADIIGFSQQKVNRLFTIDTRTEKFPVATLDIVMKISEMFVNIDPDWLLHGRGKINREDNTKNAKIVTVENGNTNGNENGINPNMQKLLPNTEEPDTDKNKYQVNKFILKTDRKNDHQVIPIYNMEASAGLVQLLDNPNSQNPVDYISIPNLPNCDGALFVTGDSMYPLLKSGDIVAYKNVLDLKNDIFWGEMYLVSLNMSGEELVTIKYVQKSEKVGHIKLVSQNKHHQDKDVKLSKVRALALIKASIRYNLLY